MKAEIISQFVDKHTGVLYKPGMLIDFSEARIEEIQAKDPGLIKVEHTAEDPGEVTPADTSEETFEEAPKETHKDEPRTTSGKTSKTKTKNK